MMAMPAFAHLFGCFAGRPSLSRGRASRCSRLPQRTRAGTVAAAVTCNSRPPWTVDVDGVKDDLLYDLETRLHDAVELENFEVARTTRDEITRLQSGAFVDVLQAYMAFYRAFDSQSIVDIAKVLAQDVTTCKHPIGPLIVGYLEVINSFGSLFSTGMPSIKPQNPRISMRGSVAYVACEEVIAPRKEASAETPDAGAANRGKGNFGDVEMVMAAINIFVKRNGQYLLTHHSSSPRGPIDF